MSEVNAREFERFTLLMDKKIDRFENRLEKDLGILNRSVSDLRVSVESVKGRLLLLDKVEADLHKLHFSVNSLTEAIVAVKTRSDVMDNEQKHIKSNMKEVLKTTGKATAISGGIASLMVILFKNWDKLTSLFK